VKVELEPPRKLRKVTLIIEANRGAFLKRESRLAFLKPLYIKPTIQEKKVLSRVYH